MSNETITLSRELAERLDSDHSYVRNLARLELREVLAEPVPFVIDLDTIDWQAIQQAASESNWMPPEYMRNDWVSDVCEFLRNRSEPVPPTGGDPESFESWWSSLASQWSEGVAKTAAYQAWSFQSAHVTRLQAEVERLHGRVREEQTYVSELAVEHTAMQSELTKALECIDHVLGLLRADKSTHAQHAIILYQGVPSNEFNQSAPSDKDN